MGQFYVQDKWFEMHFQLHVYRAVLFGSLVVGIVCHIIDEYDVHVTVDGDKFLKIKPTICTDFSNLFLE